MVQARPIFHGRYGSDLESYNSIGGGNSNIFCFYPYPWGIGNDPHLTSAYFSNGLKPPTRIGRLEPGGLGFYFVTPQAIIPFIRGS